LAAKKTVGIFQPNVLVILNQIDVIRLETLQRFVNLPRRRVFRPAVEFGHQKYLLPVTIAQRRTHPLLALTEIIIPAVIHEVDAAIDGAPNNPDRHFGIGRMAEVIAAQSDRRHVLFCFPESSINHVFSCRIMAKLGIIWPSYVSIMVI
jgi:hypothetical protein